MKHLFLVLAFLGFAGSANASILLEPSLAVDMSKNDFTPKGGGSDLSGKATLIDPGVRLGYESALGLFVAADYQMAMAGKYTFNVAGTTPSKMSRSQLWIDVGYDAPLLFRVWAGYAVMNKLDLKADDGSQEVKFTGGSSIKLGVGFNVIPLLSINVEYLMNNWSKYDAGVASGSTSSAYDSSKGSAVLVGASIPFTF